MASFRPSPETFTVEEVPAYPPSGAGEHTFLWVEKRSLTTLDAVGALGARLGIPAREMGYAGMKDRHATTRQWMSAPRIAPDLALAAGSPGLRVLRAERHGNKLRVGHLRGNRFGVLLDELAHPSEADELRGRLDALVREGLPNRYGDQRFGVLGDNVERGVALLRGERQERDQRLRRLLLSAVQSAVFNEVLARRAAAHQLRRVLSGDVLQKTDTGGIFYTDDPARDQLRVDAGAVVITGPLPGAWALEPALGSAARAIEDQALAAVGVSRAQLAAFGKHLPGTRRPLLVAVTLDDLEVGEGAPAEDPAAPARARLSFQLPAGTYATVLVAALGVRVEPPGSRARRMDLLATPGLS